MNPVALDPNEQGVAWHPCIGIIAAPHHATQEGIRCQGLALLMKPAIADEERANPPGKIFFGKVGIATVYE